MNDLELCKKIAKIEGVLVVENGGDLWQYIKVGATCVKTLIKPYNPLTNKALLFDLMVKHKVDIVHGKTLSEAKIYDDPEDNPLASISFYHDDSGYERPILECIVEANR